MPTIVRTNWQTRTVPPTMAHQKKTVSIDVTPLGREAFEMCLQSIRGAAANLASGPRVQAYPPRPSGVKPPPKRTTVLSAVFRGAVNEEATRVAPTGRSGFEAATRVVSRNPRPSGRGNLPPPIAARRFWDYDASSKGHAMPVFHFTYHAYRSWMPDREEGFVQKHRGPQPKNEKLARAYAEAAEWSCVLFDSDDQQFLIETVLDVCGRRSWRLHAAATEPTHLHAVVSWRDETK